MAAQFPLAYRPNWDPTRDHQKSDRIDGKDQTLVVHLQRFIERIIILGMQTPFFYRIIRPSNFKQLV